MVGLGAREPGRRRISATARDLETEVAEKRFREDLYYRLTVVRLHIPPLRERKQDLEGLAAALLARCRDRSGRDARFHPAALETIKRSRWPGNVRELENAIERAVVLSEDGLIRPEQLVSRTQLSSAESVAGVATLHGATESAERRAIEAALAESGGNRRAAARRLGISVRSLFYKIKGHGLE